MREPRQLTEVTSPEALQELNQALREIVRQINLPELPVYTAATRPAATAVRQGTVIFVSDGGVGSVFQGSNGTAWVSLG